MTSALDADPKLTATTEALETASKITRYHSDSQIKYGSENSSGNEKSEEFTTFHLIPNEIGPYEIRGTVGEGAFSIVKLSYNRNTNKYHACKIIERLRLKENDLESRFESEIRVHQQLHHPGIVELVDILKDEYFYYVFLEFCPGGEIFQHIVDNKRLSEQQAKPIIKQVLSAVEYIHSMNVAHRDLKPENLLLDHLGHTKISDFGLSRFLTKDGLGFTPCGSPCYASPECISGNPYDGKASDCWSVGVIFYTMITGELPWTKRKQTQLFEQIRQGDYKIPSFITPLCADFITGLMCVNYRNRLSATQALHHPFLSDATIPLESVSIYQNSFVSLRKIDEFFGRDMTSDVNIILEKNISEPAIGFRKMLRRISRAQKKRKVHRARVRSMANQLPSPELRQKQRSIIRNGPPKIVIGPKAN
ncbi:CAMK family protein kinase [Histomonas meleagridis]|uniref:CAMK family protein kinase n=1 Tax=Histomonas meleagridis TaxID=135588 RepID=UPI00355A2CA0|nr:CAMK family protein kinase [Histomonas meleagridis]KAH0801528.1 CAMK family protein kinase [Histomonas meleagridis]